MRELWLVRHGETEWSRDGRHTSYTDVGLTATGRQAAIGLGRRLPASFAAVFTSPRLRAHATARLAGFADATVVAELAEWNYGRYEGLTTVQIRQQVPDWTVWTHPSPGGERPAEVTARLRVALQRFVQVDGDVLVFGHGHASRALAALWIGQPIELGRSLLLHTASTSVLGHDRGTPVIVHWNSALPPHVDQSPP